MGRCRRPICWNREAVSWLTPPNAWLTSVSDSFPSAPAERFTSASEAIRLRLCPFRGTPKSVPLARSHPHPSSALGRPGPSVSPQDEACNFFGFPWRITLPGVFTEDVDSAFETNCHVSSFLLVPEKPLGFMLNWFFLREKTCCPHNDSAGFIERLSWKVTTQPRLILIPIEKKVVGLS